MENNNDMSLIPDRGRLDVGIEGLPEMIRAQLADMSWAQLQMYRSKKEFVFGIPGTGSYKRKRRFVRKIQDNMIQYPNKVSRVMVTGESGGTGKEGECGQWLAQILLNPRFKENLFDATGKEPMAWYLSLGMGFRELRNEGRVTSVHPNYDLSDFEKAWYRLALNRSLARINLPRMYPDYAHFIVEEQPFSLIDHFSMEDNPLEFYLQDGMVFRLTNPQAQADAADAREAFNPDVLNADFVERLGRLSVRFDTTDEVTISNSWNFGNKKAAQRAREGVNLIMLDAKTSGRWDDAPSFTLKDLETKPDFRNRTLLPQYALYRARKWGLHRGQLVIDDGIYNPGDKHYWKKLLRVCELPTKEIRDCDALDLMR